MPAEGIYSQLLFIHPPWQEGVLLITEARALIFANGVQINLDAVAKLLRPGDFCIAADGGLRFLRCLDRAPGVLIGDLDSASSEDVDWVRQAGGRILQYPAHKDETDLELALLLAVGEGYRTLLVLGALGGRLDMALGNIGLLQLPELAGCDVRLEDGIEEVFIIDAHSPPRSILGSAGDRVSLLPWGGAAHGIRTAGLYYPLNGETLYPERTRGISNQMISDLAQVSVEAGALICIHTRQPAE
jgi:thiamine pyrophosphokinase